MSNNTIIGYYYNYYYLVVVSFYFFQTKLQKYCYNILMILYNGGPVGPVVGLGYYCYY